jgi:hypothetical protein
MRKRYCLQAYPSYPLPIPLSWKKYRTTFPIQKKKLIIKTVQSNFRWLLLVSVSISTALLSSVEIKVVFRFSVSKAEKIGSGFPYDKHLIFYWEYQIPMILPYQSFAVSYGLIAPRLGNPFL